jgi:hypothetical protein
MTRAASDVPHALHAGLVTAAAALALQGCAGGNSDTSPTVNAQSVSSNPPAPNSSAVLNWSPVTSDTAGKVLSDLAGYEIHYGTSGDTLSSLIVVNDPQQTTYTITGLGAGTWYFSVNAYTSGGVEGLQSNVASKTIN